MPFFSKCLNEDRAETSYFAAIFSIFSAIAATCAVFNDQWININHIVEPTIIPINATGNFLPARRIVPACTHLGARLFWHTSSPNIFVDDNWEGYASSFRMHDNIFMNCINQVVAYLFYCAISLCFVITTLSLFSATLHALLPTPKFLEWLRRNIILEACCVLLMFAVCLLTWRAKREVELHRLARVSSNGDGHVEVCVGNGMFYVICSGAFSFIAATFSLYQNKLVSRSRREENQRFICTRALRSWRDHVENSRLALPYSLASTRPTELERYLFDACQDRASTSSQSKNPQLQHILVEQPHRSNTVSSTVTVAPVGDLENNHP